MKKKQKIVALLSHDDNIEVNDEWNRDFWLNVPDEVKFQATIELVQNAWLMKGKKLDDLRLKRYIGFFKPA